VCVCACVCACVCVCGVCGVVRVHEGPVDHGSRQDGMPEAGGDVEVSARPSPLPAGVFWGALAGGAETVAGEQRVVEHTGLAACLQRSPSRPRARRMATSVNLGRRKRSKKKRMEAAVAGFRCAHVLRGHWL
jgi:hypothetical protein